MLVLTVGRPDAFSEVGVRAAEDVVFVVLRGFANDILSGQGWIEVVEVCWFTARLTTSRGCPSATMPVGSWAVDGAQVVEEV